MRILFIYFLVLVAGIARAERFEEFLSSLDAHYPLHTEFMQSVLKAYNTKLARPSLLEKWGVINTDAAATYNGILNTIVLKDDYTIESVTATGNKSRRIKSVDELRAGEPIVWTIRAQTIFHELSHAEFGWLPRSTDLEDKALLHFLDHDFDDYLKIHQKQYSKLDRVIARSELFAYFRADFLSQLMTSIDAILIENGYFSSSKTCRNTQYVIAKLKTLPRERWTDYAVFGTDEDFTKMALPTIFVKGKDADMDPKDPASILLQKLLWAQVSKHFTPARSKSDVVKWMNSRPQFRSLIESCRSALVANTN